MQFYRPQNQNLNYQELEILCLSPLSWTLPEKPPVAQLLKNIPTLYGTLRFIATASVV
jgi:hypothetical protein